MTTLVEVAELPIRDVPRRALVQAQTDEKVVDVVQKMHESHRGVVLVMDGGSLVGVFTARDLMARCDHSSDAWQSTTVSEVMTANPVTAHTEDKLRTAINRMVTGNYRHLPILGSDGEVVGVLSIRDLLKHIVGYFPQNFINLPPDPKREAKGPWGG